MHRITAAALGSVGLLGGALAFQYLGGLYPCQMCIWQRWPHGLAIAVGVVALMVPTARRPLAIVGGLVVLVGAGIGLFHAGVEQGWWEGVTACASGQDVGGLSAEELLNQILEAPVVRCDEIPWSLGGLSMAAWNAVLSLALAILWLSAGRRRLA
ncbi:MAG: disulfide bond formation protein B [Pseudomonadota bacterium]